MVAFAANSVLCRLALGRTDLDPATFTSLRLLSGSVVLALLVRSSGRRGSRTGSWPSAFALFVYAAAFSFAYLSLSTGTGALLLFGAVQLTMILAGLWSGERLGLRQTIGLALALGGLVYLLLPGVTAPAVGGALSMIAAGIAWGVYSLRGRGSTQALADTAGNFWRAAIVGVILSLATLGRFEWNSSGALYACLSGAVASGLGYAVWYTVLPSLRATSASIVQLSVPVLAAAGGLIALGESLTLRLAIASVATLGGIAMVLERPATRPDKVCED